VVPPPGRGRAARREWEIIGHGESRARREPWSESDEARPRQTPALGPSSLPSLAKVESCMQAGPYDRGESFEDSKIETKKKWEESSKSSCN
jgi:hypothetical protein